MPETAKFLANRLLIEGQKSAQYFRDFPVDKWNSVIYTDGEQWSPKQILAHLLATEISLLDLLKNILSGGEGVPLEFDLDYFNHNKVFELENYSTDKMIDLFRENRQNTVDFVLNLTDSELEIQGRHPFLGVAPIHEIIKIIYRHNQIHQREIRGALVNNERGEN